MSARYPHRPVNPLDETMEAGAEGAEVPPDSHVADDLVGRKIGQYQIERKIGEGGMGVVYEGVHDSLGQRVAIKLLHGHLGMDTKTAKRFFNEARAISIVQHPGLVKIHHYEQLEGGAAYLVMEYLQGETLEDRLSELRLTQGRLPLPRVLAIARQVASALEAAHGSGIVHCDLKPDNIFLCPDAAAAGGERVKVLDFGIAKFLSETGGKKTTAGLVLGTPRYMSPEQCEGRDKVDSKVDVYALGVILYELLGGQPPFEAETSAALMRQHMVKAPPPLSERAPDVPVPLQHLVSSMLSKDGAERPTMAEVLRRLDGDFVAAPPPAPAPASRRALALAGGAALLLCAAGGAYLALGRAAPTPAPATPVVSAPRQGAAAAPAKVPTMPAAPEKAPRGPEMSADKATAAQSPERKPPADPQGVPGSGPGGSRIAEAAAAQDPPAGAKGEAHKAGADARAKRRPPRTRRDGAEPTPASPLKAVKLGP